MNWRLGSAGSVRFGVLPLARASAQPHVNQDWKT